MSTSRDLADGIAARLRGAGHRALFAGGCVRDLLMGSEPKDWDIATSARPDEIQRLFERTVPVGAAFGVIIVLPDGQTPFEVATFRKDLGYTDFRRPDAVEFTDEEEDARRRDFTINALFLEPVSGEVIDYVDGRADIDRRLVRAVGDPEQRIAEDRLRMLRAIRFAARLHFAIDRSTYAAVKRHASTITHVSAERIRDELTKMLIAGDAAVALELLRASGLLGVILPEAEAMVGVPQPPEFHPEGDVWDHTLLLLARLHQPTVTLAWSALLHDVGKPPTIEFADRIRFNGHAEKSAEMADEILRRLRFSNDEREQIVTLARGHLRFKDVRNMRPAKLKRFLRQPYFDEHLELHRLDCMASHGLLDHYAFCRSKLEEIGPEDLSPPRLVTGRDLIELGLAPGPIFTEILREVEDAQLDGRLQSREEALSMVRERHARS